MVNDIMVTVWYYTCPNCASSMPHIKGNVKCQFCNKEYKIVLEDVKSKEDRESDPEVMEETYDYIGKQAKEAVERGKERKNDGSVQDLWKKRYLDLVDRVTKLEQTQANLEKKVKELESRSPFYLTYTYTMPNYSANQTGGGEECLCDKCAYKNFPVTTNGYYPCYYCYWAKYKTCGGKR